MSLPPVPQLGESFSQIISWLGDVLEWQLALPIVGVLVVVSVGFTVLGVILMNILRLVQFIFNPSVEIGGEQMNIMDFQSAAKFFRAGKGILRGDGD